MNSEVVKRDRGAIMDEEYKQLNKRQCRENPTPNKPTPKQPKPKPFMVVIVSNTTSKMRIDIERTCIFQATSLEEARRLAKIQWVRDYNNLTVDQQHLLLNGDENAEAAVRAERKNDTEWKSLFVLPLQQRYGFHLVESVKNLLDGSITCSVSFYACDSDDLHRDCATRLVEWASTLQQDLQQRENDRLNTICQDMRNALTTAVDNTDIWDEWNQELDDIVCNLSVPDSTVISCFRTTTVVVFEREPCMMVCTQKERGVGGEEKVVLERCFDNREDAHKCGMETVLGWIDKYADWEEFDDTKDIRDMISQLEDSLHACTFEWSPRALEFRRILDKLEEAVRQFDDECGVWCQYRITDPVILEID
eukprot:GILJ01012087.1.p2 GENE.GILJ01012087.1~~GILJ01012087.1.p2  ORF type:complete len:364 (+),score=38.49 GILJ01012087.1:195-1286(+)